MATMDPLAPLPVGSDLSVAIAGAPSPLAAVRATATGVAAESLAALQPPRPKRLRKPKEKPPIGRNVPPALLRNQPVADDAATGLVEGRILGRLPAMRQSRSRAVPSALATPAAPAAPAVTTFIGGKDTQTVVPPDTAGGVGPSFVLTALNDMVYVHDRAGKVLSARSLDAFWQGLLGAPVETFDPRIVFDPFSRRFYFATMTDAEKESSAIMLAVSETSDPGGAWRPVHIAVERAQGRARKVWLDFPSIGFSADKITLTVDLYTIKGSRFGGASIYVFEKADFLRDAPSIRVKRFDLFKKGSTFVPAVTRDRNVADHWLANRWSRSQLALYNVTGSVADGTVNLTPAGFVESPGPAWNSFGRLPDGEFLKAPQKSSRSKLDPGDDRLLSLVLRQGTLHASHGIFLPRSSPDRTAAQIWNIDTGSFATTTFRIDHPGGAGGQRTAPIFASYPTLDVNDDGDLLVGHAWLSAKVHPSGALTFIPKGNHKAAATMVFAGGLDIYPRSDRWGDYSITQVDPDNDHDFWTQQERAAKRKKGGKTWQTVWAKLTPAGGGTA